MVDLALRHCVSPTLTTRDFQTLSLAAVTGCRLGLPDTELQGLVVAALLADIGMSRLPSISPAGPPC